MINGYQWVALRKQKQQDMDFAAKSEGFLHFLLRTNSGIWALWVNTTHKTHYKLILLNERIKHIKAHGSNVITWITVCFNLLNDHLCRFIVRTCLSHMLKPRSAPWSIGPGWHPHILLLLSNRMFVRKSQRWLSGQVCRCFISMVVDGRVHLLPVGHAGDRRAPFVVSHYRDIESPKSLLDLMQGLGEFGKVAPPMANLGYCAKTQKCSIGSIGIFLHSELDFNWFVRL